MTKFWIVCTEGFDFADNDPYVVSHPKAFSGKGHHFAIANGAFDCPDKAKAFVTTLIERYKGKLSDADVSIFGPVLLNIGYSMLKNDKSVHDGKEWIKETTLKAKAKAKKKQKKIMSDPDRPVDMDFDIEGF